MAASVRPIALAGDLNVVPTDFDIHNPGWWRDRRCDATRSTQSVFPVAVTRLDGCGATPSPGQADVYLLDNRKCIQAEQGNAAGFCAAQRSAQVATNAGGSMRHFEEATNPAIMHRCGLNLPIRTRNARQPERGARAGRGKVGLIHRRSKQP
jgi:hypothetical protein